MMVYLKSSTRAPSNERSAEGERRRPQQASRLGNQSQKSAARLAKRAVGKPGRKTEALVEITRLARELSPAAIEKLNSIVHDPKALDRDKIAAANSILDRGLGKPAFPVFHGGSGMSSPMELEDGTPVSPLLLAAGKSRDAAYKAELQAELRRIEAEEAQMRTEMDDELADARAAQARGEEISPSLRMLIAVKDDTEGHGHHLAERNPRHAAPCFPGTPRARFKSLF